MKKWNIRYQRPIFPEDQAWFHDCHANTQVLMPSGTGWWFFGPAPAKARRIRQSGCRAA